MLTISTYLINNNRFRKIIWIESGYKFINTLPTYVVLNIFEYSQIQKETKQEQFHLFQEDQVDDFNHNPSNDNYVSLVINNNVSQPVRLKDLQQQTLIKLDQYKSNSQSVYLVKNISGHCQEFYIYSPLILINDTRYDFNVHSHKLIYNLSEGQNLYPGGEEFQEFKLSDITVTKKPKTEYYFIEGSIGCQQLDVIIYFL